jgi:hypothetical protein
MLSYEADRAALRPLVPPGTELDCWQGEPLLTLVGFLFLDTKVLGVPVPFHRDFTEVNLRFYVRRKASDGWRRAVVFVEETVPSAAIAWTARAVYGEDHRSRRWPIGSISRQGPHSRRACPTSGNGNQLNSPRVRVGGGSQPVRRGIFRSS